MSAARSSAIRQSACIAWLLALAAIATAVHAQPRSENAARPGRTHANSLRWPRPLDQPPEWFASDDAVRIADNLLLYQHPNGGWPKNIDMAATLDDQQKQEILRSRDRAKTMIDNGATHTQIRYLALVYDAAHDRHYADACRRGIDYLLTAQYPNGGWPQIFPLQKNYSAHITFNDGSMIGVMKLLRDVAGGKKPFEFIDDDQRQRSQQAINKGLDAIFQCQVVVDGQPTAWCAQHDEVDFKPRAARTYELASLSGSESVGIVEYLMKLDSPTPEVKRAVDAAIAWFEAAKIEGVKVTRIRNDDLDPPFDLILEDDADAEPLWARFYEIGTNRPMFVGRDGVVHDRLADIEHERRTNYSYIGPYARDLLDRKYPAWKKKRDR